MASQRTSSCGTQSPPLEATGSHTVLGASSVHTVGQPIEVVPDSVQRKEYFNEEPVKDTSKAGAGQMKTQKMGESMADKFDKMD